MRAALSSGVLLLFLVLALNLSAGSYDRWLPSGLGGEEEPPGTNLRIFSCGEGLPPARFQNRKHWEGIFVDGRMYSHRNAESGLRIVSVEPLGELEFENFDVADDPTAVDELDEFLRARPVGTVLAMGLMRTAIPGGPEDEARSAGLASALARIGAQAPPLEHGKTSWAFLSFRGERGWTPVAEKRSELKGVMLAMSLPRELSAIAKRPAPAVRVDERCELALYDVLEGARLDGFTRTWPVYAVANVPKRTLEALTPHGSRAKGHPTRSSRIVFPFVRIEQDAIFRSAIGHRSDVGHLCSGVRFEVLVDGVVLGAQELFAQPSAWQTFEVDLSSASGRWAELELRVTPLDDADWSERHWAEPAAWGDPVLLYRCRPRRTGTDGQPALDLVDGNYDGALTPPEVRAFTLRYDKNGDGFVALDEAPEALSLAMQPADADGDRRASVEEIDAWIEMLWRP